MSVCVFSLCVGSESGEDGGYILQAMVGEGGHFVLSQVLLVCLPMAGDVVAL